MITTEEAARLIGCRKWHVTRLIRAGAVRATRFGKVWAVDEGSAREYAATPHPSGWPKGRAKCDAYGFAARATPQGEQHE